MASQHIMIVDDNDGLTRTMTMILKKNGHVVVVAKDGIEALEQVREGIEIDLIFMDIKMPRMNGVEAYKHIREILPDARVIMMTAYAVDNLIQEALSEGAYSIIYKPFDFDILISLIDSAQTKQPSKHILIIDDNKTFSVTFKNILSRRGFCVHTAEQSDEAIEKVRTEKYDLVFLDMKLPGESGLEAFNAIRNIRPDINVIVITAFDEDMQDHIAKVLLNHGLASLRKPLDMKMVFALIEEILGSGYSTTIR